MEFTERIWSVIYTTNWMERTIKKYRKRLKLMNSIPTIQAAKIVYLKSTLISRRWSKLDKMFAERDSISEKTQHS